MGATQFRSTWCDSPVPLKGRFTVGFVDELLLMVSCPDAEPIAVGLNVSVTLRVCPGLSVAGRLTGEAEKPLPVTATEFTVRAAIPLDVSVIVWVVGVLTTTPPNEMLVAFTVSAGVAAFSCNEVARVVVPVVAVSVTD